MRATARSLTLPLLALAPPTWRAGGTVPSTPVHDPAFTLTAEQLAAYDLILVALSGGKDSVAAFLLLLELGVPREKLELAHHEVDGREGSTLMDWPCTPAYVRAFAAAFGVPVFFSWREGGFEREMLRDGTATAPVLFETPGGEIRRVGGEGDPGRRLKFPMPVANLQTRWCSGKLKTTPKHPEGGALLEGPGAVGSVGVREQGMHARVPRGWLAPSERSGPGRVRWFELDDATIARLQDLKLQRWKAPLKRSDGLYSLRAVAARLDVSLETVRYWVIQGWLQPSDRRGHGRLLWFKLDAATLSRLRAIQLKHTRKGRSHAGK